jgi:hypothetical protein
MQTENDWKEAVAIMEKEKVLAPGSKPTDYFTNEYIDGKTVAALAAK